jgi:hypothetical protein
MLGIAALVRALDAYWLSRNGALDRKEAGENLIVIAQPFELMIGKQKPVSRFLSSVHPMPVRVREKDELLRILHREFAQHHRIHDRKNRSVGADAERERDNYYGRKAWSLQQTSDSIADVF